jgi:hypothetical protein
VKPVSGVEQADKTTKQKGIEMINQTEDTSLDTTARVAGLAFLVILIGYTLTWIFVYSRLIVAGNAAVTARNIIANESLFRIGLTGDLVIAISGIVLSVALYIILKPVNRNLALFALCLKLAEAVLALITVSLSFIAMQMVTGEAYLTAGNPEQVQELVGLFLNLHVAASTIPMVLTGLGFIIFFSLFFTSKFIPRIVSGFGILSYVLILLYAFMTILSPNLASIMEIQIICWAPSCILELTIGIWLFLKGVNVPPGNNPGSMF